jgi:hypothetical protein
MSRKRSKVTLLSPRHNMPEAVKQFRCGERIPESGIYRVVHERHRLPHEVTLLRDQLFPKCIKCDGLVSFELIRGAPDITLGPFKVALYALPLVDEDEKTFTAAS